MSFAVPRYSKRRPVANVIEEEMNQKGLETADKLWKLWKEGGLTEEENELTREYLTLICSQRFGSIQKGSIYPLPLYHPEKAPKTTNTLELNGFLPSCNGKNVHMVDAWQRFVNGADLGNLNVISHHIRPCTTITSFIDTNGSFDQDRQEFVNQQYYVLQFWYPCFYEASCDAFWYWSHLSNQYEPLTLDLFQQLVNYQMFDEEEWKNVFDTQWHLCGVERLQDLLWLKDRPLFTPTLLVPTHGNPVVNLLAFDQLVKTFGQIENDEQASLALNEQLIKMCHDHAQGGYSAYLQSFVQVPLRVKEGVDPEWLHGKCTQMVQNKACLDQFNQYMLDDMEDDTDDENVIVELKKEANVNSISMQETTTTTTHEKRRKRARHE